MFFAYTFVAPVGHVPRRDRADLGHNAGHAGVAHGGLVPWASQSVDARCSTRVMNVDNLVLETEQQLRTLSTELTEPRPSECLLCYVHRMLEHGCTGLRWASHYRDRRAPRATSLERRLARKGGYCDCEIFLNAYQLDPRHVVSRAEDDFDLTWETALRAPVLSCRGVRRGSTQGCELWRPLSQGW
jgi:hypothetical protein